MIYSTIYTLDGELFKSTLPKFIFEKYIKANIETVFEVFSNFENYQELLPLHFPSVRIRSSRGNVSIVEEHMNFSGQEIVIMAKHVMERPNLHEIFVIGGDAKGSYIKQQFQEISQGTKILVYLDLKLKGRMKLHNMFRKGKLEQNYSDILDDFKKIVET